MGLVGTVVDAAIGWLVQSILGNLFTGQMEAWTREVGLAKDVENLKIEKGSVEMVLAAAAGRRFENEPLARKLDELKELLYDAKDVMDELDYYRLQQQIEEAYKIAMACNIFSEIDVGKELLKIKARVARHWDAVIISTGELISLHMILIDEEGTKMHGVINKHYVDKFRSLIQEGNVYIITNVKVTLAAKFRPVDNDKVLNFLPTTTLEKIEDTEDIPRHGFKFSDIDMLSKRIGDMVYLSDVIGVATYIGPIEETRTNFGVSNIRDIVVLIDYEEVKVRLWGDKAEQIDVSATAKTIVVTSTTVKKFGSYSLSSSNATRVYLNLPIPETMEVQNRNCSRENTIKQIGNDDHLKGTFEQQMEYNKKTLQELNEILNDSSNKARIFTVEATINAINTRYGWYYISCNDDNCKKQLEKKGDRYYCGKCDKKAKPTPRYKIKLEISDSTATATCVLFEKEAQKLISESVSFMVESINHDTKEVPKPVQKICGQTLTFQFRLTDYNIKSCKPDYTVSRLFIPVGKNSSTIKIKKDEENTLIKIPKDVIIKQEPQEEDKVHLQNDNDSGESEGVFKTRRIHRQKYVVHLDDDEEESEGQCNIRKILRRKKRVKHLEDEEAMENDTVKQPRRSQRARKRKLR